MSLFATTYRPNGTIIQQEIRQYYNELALSYDANRFANSYGYFIDSLERPILEHLLRGEVGSVLEIACGTGRFLEYANIGVDASPKMLNVARNKFPEKQLIEAACDSIPLPNDSQNVIYAFHLLMHLNAQILHSWSEETKRLLAPDGRWIVDVPTGFRRGFRRRKSGWHGSYSPSLHQFEELGWSVDGIHPLLSLPIHRIPSPFRYALVGLDQRLSRILPHHLSSYQILVLRAV